MAAIMTAENTNVPPSAMNAQPGPSVPTRMLPSAGPSTINANGRTNWSTEFARTRSSGGTICGTIDWNDGWNRACPTPNTMTRPTMIGIVSTSVIDRTPTVTMAAHRTRSPVIMSMRRSRRSARAPDTNTSSTWGRLHASPTNASADGRFDRS